MDRARATIVAVILVAGDVVSGVSHRRNVADRVVRVRSRVVERVDDLCATVRATAVRVVHIRRDAALLIFLGGNAPERVVSLRRERAVRIRRLQHAAE